MRDLSIPICLLLTCFPALSQAPQATAAFEIASIQLSPPARNPFLRTSAAKGRYELKNATMVDLVRTAYGVTPDRVLGGPNWLELDRFDIVAKMPADTTVEDRRLMLQSLLAERFKLAVHNDTRPMPSYSLTAGKKPSLKQADDKGGDTGCRPEQSSGAPAEGGMRLFTEGPNGRQQTITLGPGGSIHMVCRNMTMAAFASSFRGMMGSPDLGPNPVLDATGLEGAWDFDFRYSLNFIGPMPGSDGERVSMTLALEKIGLKLEQKPVATSVIVVDRVDRKPSPDPAGVDEALPPVKVPTEFEVADIKQTDPNFRGGMSRTMPGGRFTAQGMTLRNLVMRAFNANGMGEEIVGLPSFASGDRWDITAKAPSEGAPGAALDFESTGPLLRALLAERFKMTYHTESRKLSAYSLIAVKPKLKKADPDARSSCKQQNNAPGTPPGTMTLSCQNVTMEYFASRLQNLAFGTINFPVEDATGLEGGYDVAMSFSPNAGMNFGGPGRGGNPAGGENAVPTASDPTAGMTIFEAIEKLGLKLDQRKRNVPVIVIDHIEQKPTEN
jgi:uncharacterized protein (TIGR03435 family)